MAGVTNKSEYGNRVVPRSSVVASTNSSRSSSVVDASFVSIASTSSSGSNSYEVESEVGREALREICCSILSRVLDFPDGQLETFLGAGEGTEDIERKHEGVNVAKNITAGLRFMKKGLSAVSHVYYQQPGQVENFDNATAQVLVMGTPVTSQNQVPLIQTITHMHKYVLLEGLFRKPGSKLRIDQMVIELERNGISGVVANVSYTGHDYASLLKQFLSELPEPLLIKRHINAYIQASELSSTSSKVRCIQLLMLLLPPCHRIVLQHLLDLFSQVICSCQSRMDALNLALVFAPTLFLASRSESLSAASLSSLTSLLKFMIENPEEIFEVPVEVQVVAERYCRKKKDILGSRHGDTGSDVDEDVAMDMYSTCCKRECIEDFHKAGRERAAAEVAQLKDFIMRMPDGPQKAHFLKRFDSAKKHSGTPAHSRLGFLRTRLGSSSKSKHCHSFRNNKENVTPRSSAKSKSGTDALLKPCIKKGSLFPELCETPCKNNPSLLKQVRIKAADSSV